MGSESLIGCAAAVIAWRSNGEPYRRRPLEWSVSSAAIALPCSKTDVFSKRIGHHEADSRRTTAGRGSKRALSAAIPWNLNADWHRCRTDCTARFGAGNSVSKRWNPCGKTATCRNSDSRRSESRPPELRRPEPHRSESHRSEPHIHYELVESSSHRGRSLIGASRITSAWRTADVYRGHTACGGNCQSAGATTPSRRNSGRSNRSFTGRVRRRHDGIHVSHADDDTQRRQMAR
jgi:hypothetical protein